MKRNGLIIALVLLCLVCVQGMAQEETVIVHATDIHYLSPSLTDHGDYFMDVISSADGKVTHYTPEIVQAFVYEMLSLRPDAVVFSGDLTLNGAPESHKELAVLLTPLRDEGIQVLMLPGNHDTGAAAYRFEGDGVTSVEGTPDEEFDDIYASLGFEDALSRDTASMSYIARVSDKVWCLMVDVNANGTLGTVKEETFKWLEEQLSLAQQEQITVIAVSHQPLLVHNAMFTFGYVVNNNTRLLKLYEQYGVQLNLCGHLHTQHVATENNLTEICASSFAVSPNQYGVLRIKDGVLQDYAMQPLNVNAWAEETEKTDPNLLDFNAYSAAFFDETTRGKQTATLAEVDIPDADREKMLDFAVRLNREYFAGNRTVTQADDGWQQWQTYGQSAFFFRYMQNILAEEAADMTRVDFIK